MKTTSKIMLKQYKGVQDQIEDCQPRLKKGLAKGLAHKYYGPFQIMEKNTNQVEYVDPQVKSRSKFTKIV